MSGYFITGTDTGVGKTLITGGLMLAMQDRSLVVAPMKPVAAGTLDVSGVAMNEDVALMLELSGHRFPRHAVNPYCFAEPIAPHIAARHENIVVDMKVVRTAYATLAARADVVLVEGAGGFLVPMSDTESMAQIPAALQLPVILVVAMRLGCINHALLTVEAIRARGLVLAGWVANSPGAQMAVHDENLATLDRLIAAPRLGLLARLDAATSAQAARLASTQLDTGLLTVNRRLQ
jgi:dethiobiotin synthetase